MEPYTRRVFYYETDQMGIVHHSNYIRWMEEARLDSMSRLGLDYGQIEARGILMPVTGVECEYKISARFDETVFISVTPTLFNGVRACFSYEIRNSRGELLARGKSGHCFIHRATRKPLNLKRHMPEYSAQFEKAITE